MHYMDPAGVQILRLTSLSPCDLHSGTLEPTCSPCLARCDTRRTAHASCCIFALFPSRTCASGVVQCPEKQLRKVQRRT